MSTPSIAAGSVVVGIDGSEHSERAATWAADVAAREHRPLVLVHTVRLASGWMLPPIVDVGTLNREIADAAEVGVDRTRQRLQQAHSGLEVKTVCTIDDPRDVLIELSRHAHLVVVGSRGRGPVRRLVLGSVASAVVRHARCPVVVLPARPAAPEGRGVVVGIGGTRSSLPTLELAFRAASWRSEPLRVVHCFSDPYTEDGQALVAPSHSDYLEERVLVSELLAGLREKYADVEVTVELDRALMDDVLEELTPTAGLVVVGSQEHDAVTDFVIGSVATALIQKSRCPVAVVPHTTRG
jgi:nucleotide-binding universal stress UspA family protein